MGQELIQHHKIGSGYIHKVTNWRFQTTASRMDEVSNQFVAADVDKMCYDMETQKYYMLESVHPSSGVPTWYELPYVTPETQGEVNTASNVGTGIGLYKEKVGVDLKFKTVVQGSNMLITVDANEVTFSAVVPDFPDVIDPDIRPMTAGEFIGGTRVVSMKNNTEVLHTVPTDYIMARQVLGISKGAAVNGTPVDVQVSGIMVEPGWSWTPDQDIFCTTSGGLTQTVPTSGYLIRVGMAITPTSMIIRIDPIISLL